MPRCTTTVLVLTRVCSLHHTEGLAVIVLTNAISIVSFDHSLAEDVLVHKDEAHPEWMWGTEITELDKRYLLLTITRDTAPVRPGARR